PTYKFDKNIAHTITAEGWVALPYDSSEKRRVPAWTDRILWRGSLPWLPSSLSHPKDMAAAALMRLRPGPDSYGCCLDVCDSDHKPVYASLELLLPVPNQELQRKHSMQQLKAELCVVFQHLASLGSGGLAGAQQQQGEGQSGQLSLLVRHTAH
ncbi:inositol polyphosphate phosphatase, partial [Haematococcus lacustris]